MSRRKHGKDSIAMLDEVAGAHGSQVEDTAKAFARGEGV
jgi:hypothetical protein